MIFLSLGEETSQKMVCGIEDIGHGINKTIFKKKEKNISRMKLKDWLCALQETSGCNQLPHSFL
jgi:hypothetical protein